MNIRSVPIAEVIPYENNPRQNDKAVPKVAQSLKQFGWKQPLVVDRDMVLVVGHTRLLAARLLGMTHVPVLVATDLSPEDAKAYRLTDNRSGEEAKWDKGLLSMEMSGLRELNFDLKLTGFETAELGRLRIGDADEPPNRQRIGDALTFQVVVDCADEADQAALLTKLKGEGRKCRPLMT